MIIAIVGATGMVGNVMLQVLAERNFPFTKLLIVASEKSVGKSISFEGKSYKVIGLEEAVNAKPTIAIFSAGGSTSLEWAPKFAKVGTTVIDNSSAWRMDITKKLVVPEINANQLSKLDKIIANPNCSTIQLVLALFPLQEKYGIKRIVISTYQSVTGTGVKAQKQLMDERADKPVDPVYPYQIDLNCLPHAGDFNEEGYTSEETKLVYETRKILSDDSIQTSATVVRVPVIGGHSESVNIELKNDFDLAEVKRLLSETDGIIVQDDPFNNVYPMPITSEGKDAVFVGRIRRDKSQPNTLNMWIVSDNLRKGAATNAIQIAEYLIANKLVI
jgi:aspartate-semialdehyde dehydrogenase